MPLMQNPQTGEFEWDYSEGGPPNTQAPWDPATGQPLSPSPNASWNGDTGGWSVHGPGSDGYDPTWGGYAPTGDPNQDGWLKSVFEHQGWPISPATTQPPPGATTTSGPGPNSGGGTGGGPGPGGGNGGGGGTGSGGGGWFAANGFGGNFGAVPAPFGETYTTLGRPSYLQGQYVPPSWTDSFQAPTMADAQNEPGYQTRMAAGQNVLEHSAASKGSLLSGGTQRGLTRYGQDFGANEYGNVYNRAFQNYQQKYGQFKDASALDLGARGINENAYQSDVSNSLSQYNTRYKAYLDAITNKRNAESDVWSRNLDLSNGGLTAGGLTNPGQG